MPSGIYLRTPEMKTGQYERTDWHKSRMGGWFKKGERNSWKGGRTIHQGGYVLLWDETHPNPSVRHYCFEHRLVMEKHLGRYLERQERVHHINGIADDNRIENLMLFANESEHQKYHQELLHA